MTPGPIAAAFRAACLLELDALKPGNVHRFAAGHGMIVAQFEAAAEAAAPAIAGAGLAVGTRIEGAVRASMAAAGCNTNLGIVLLCAPLAAAAEADGPLRPALARVLAGLTVADAAAAFRAIALANPGGLGTADRHDVAQPARVTLLEAMGPAVERDRIAHQYVSDFADIFGVARVAEAPTPAEVEATYMSFLASFPDSHIARKFGPEIARQVQHEAAEVGRRIDWAAPDAVRHAALAAFDASLKARGLNPGTSADLTVASLFAARLTP